MFNIFKFLIIFITLVANRVEARYNDINSDTDAGEGMIIVGFILIYAAYDYIKKEFKKGKSEGYIAIFLTCTIGFVLYIFPILFYALATLIIIGILVMAIRG